MNKESHDYMLSKVEQYESLKNSKDWLEIARNQAAGSAFRLGNVEVTSHCQKKICDHLIEAIQSLLAMEIQEIARKMEEL